MEENYRKACKELYVCLENTANELVSKIPDSLINKIIENMDSNHNFKYDSNKKIYEQKILDETKDLLGFIYYNYLANEKEKEEYITFLVRKDAKYSE